MSEGIGARLRGARERRRLTVLQAAERMHVDPEIVEALEADDFTALGAPVYAKGHLRHYAELLGEPVEPLFELYSQGTRLPPPDLTRIPKAAEDHVGRLVAPAVVVVLLFAAAGMVWWVMSLTHRQWATHAVSIPVHTAAPQQTQLAGPAAAPQRVLGSAPVAAVAAATAPAASRAGGAAKAAAPASGEIDATFKYSADSWTEVYDATGRRLLYGLATGPATRTLEGVPPLRVILGNATGVTVEVGGRTASISPFVRADHTARFLIAADGRVLPAPPKKGG